MLKSDEELSLGLDAFIRSLGVNRSTPNAFFLGAGASISSGVPSAAMCIWEWKKAIFLTNNPGLETQFAELSLPSVKLKIQQWLDQQRKYPPAGSPEEYGVYIQQCFPIADDRRAYFQEKVRQALPHVGYRLISELARAELIESIWTTNFDGLAARAVTGGQITVIEVGIDCQNRLLRRPNRKELLCVSLHGDYRYDALKNTPAEIQQQEKTLCDGLSELVRDTSLVILGYSGRDTSIMETLEKGYRITGTGTLYWCGFSDEEIPQTVQKLIKSRADGRNAYYVPSAAFDDVILRIALHCLQEQQSDSVRKLIATEESAPTDVRTEFGLPDLPLSGIIKGNAFEFTPPGEIYQFDLKNWPEKEVWKYFDQRTIGHQLVAAPFRSKGYAFGTIDSIRKAFDSNIKADVSRVPINDVDLRYEDGVITSLVRRVVLQAIAARSNVDSDGRELVWERNARDVRIEGGVRYLIKDAAVIYVRRIARQLYVVLKPTIRVETGSGAEAPEEVERSIKMAILGWQHNSEFNDAVEAWRKKLLPSDPAEFEFPVNCGSPFRFRIRRTPIFAKIGNSAGRSQITIPAKFQRDLKHYGVQLVEPRLVFSNSAGTGTILDTHPVRGITQNEPFDFPLTRRHLAGATSIGIVCPAPEANLLASYLQRFHQKIEPGRFEADYLPPFPGSRELSEHR